MSGDNLRIQKVTGLRFENRSDCERSQFYRDMVAIGQDLGVGHHAVFYCERRYDTFRPLGDYTKSIKKDGGK